MEVLELAFNKLKEITPNVFLANSKNLTVAPRLEISNFYKTDFIGTEGYLNIIIVNKDEAGINFLHEIMPSLSSLFGYKTYSVGSSLIQFFEFDLTSLENINNKSLSKFSVRFRHFQ